MAKTMLSSTTDVCVFCLFCSVVCWLVFVFVLEEVEFCLFGLVLVLVLQTGSYYVALTVLELIDICLSTMSASRARIRGIHHYACLGFPLPHDPLTSLEVAVVWPQPWALGLLRCTTDVWIYVCIISLCRVAWWSHVVFNLYNLQHHLSLIKGKLPGWRTFVLFKFRHSGSNQLNENTLVPIFLIFPQIFCLYNPKFQKTKLFSLSKRILWSCST